MNELKVINDEGSLFHGSIFEDIKKLSSNGENQFQKFWSERLENRVIPIRPITDPIHLNCYNMPGKGC